MPTLQFKGRNIIWNHHLAVPYHILEHEKKLDYKPEQGEGNLIIEGDNLTALKALLPKYQGKIKCIYNDPPYNTGNDNGQGKGWIYSDNVNSPLMKEWFRKEVGVDDLARHDKWLCMITPRLKLLRELLNSQGIIFTSIDDNEVYRLRELMNEIFGEENFIALLPTIMNLKGNQDEYAFAGTHEYTLVFAKDKVTSLFNEFQIDEEDETDWKEDKIGLFKKGANLKGSGVNAPREKRPNLFYPILIKGDGKTIETVSDEEFGKLYDRQEKTFDDQFLKRVTDKYQRKGYRCILPVSNGKYMSWRWQRETLLKDINDLIISKEEDKIAIYKKQRPSLGDLPSRKPKTIFYKAEYSSGNGTNQLKELFGDKVFNNPKPIELIKDLVFLGTQKDSIILDSFAGSGTTAHAVMKSNKEDGGSRKFILVQMTEATKEEPKKNICKDITSERVKRAIEKYNYKSGFEYWKVGQPLDPETLLAGQLPTFEEFAKHVFYLCTGNALKDEKKIKAKDYFVSEAYGLSIYLIYEQNIDNLMRLALTWERAQQWRKANSKKRLVVYAPACFLSEEDLDTLQIEFVNIPYNLFEKR